MKKSAGFVLAVMLFGLSALGQENKYEVTVQGSGIFPKQTTAGSVKSNPTSSGGIMTGFRVNLSNRFAVEGDYDYFRNSERFAVSNATTRIPLNIHSVTSAAVVKLPNFRAMRPFVLAGGGLMTISPRDTPGLQNQTRGAFVYGGGFDMPLPITRHVALRAQYRGFVYKILDFDNSKLKTDKYTHGAVPSAGLVLTF